MISWNCTPLLQYCSCPRAFIRKQSPLMFNWCVGLLKWDSNATFLHGMQVGKCRFHVGLKCHAHRFAGAVCVNSAVVRASCTSLSKRPTAASCETIHKRTPFVVYCICPGASVTTGIPADLRLCWRSGTRKLFPLYEMDHEM